jgi:hypothetical protein
MSTTALFVELLIVGLQSMVWIITAIGAFWGFNWLTDDSLVKSSSIIALGLVVLLAVSYSVGIAVDRIADDLLTCPNNWIKKNVARARAKKKIEKGQNVEEWSVKHYYVLHKSPGMGHVTEYIRSRMRILRGLVINIPLTTVAACLGLTRQYNGTDKVSYLALIIVIGVILTSAVAWGWYRTSMIWYKRIGQAYDIIHQSNQINASK